jgi:hypothetical protein
MNSLTIRHFFGSAGRFQVVVGDLSEIGIDVRLQVEAA